MRIKKKLILLLFRLGLLAIALCSIGFIYSFINTERRLEREFIEIQRFLNSPGDLAVLNVFNQQGSFISRQNKPYDKTRLLNLETKKSIVINGMGQFVYNNTNVYCTDEYIFTTKPLILNSKRQTASSEIWNRLGISVPFLTGITSYMSQLSETKAKKVEFAKTRFLLIDRKGRKVKQLYTDDELAGYMISQPILTQIDPERHLYHMNGFWGATGNTSKELLVSVKGNRLKLFRDLQPVIMQRNPWILIGYSTKRLLFFNNHTRKDFKVHNIETGINSLVNINNLPELSSYQQLSISLDSLDKRWVWSGQDANGVLVTLVIDLEKEQASLLKKGWSLVSGNPSQHSFVLVQPTESKTHGSGIAYTHYIHLKSQLIEIQTVFHKSSPVILESRFHADTLFIDAKAQTKPQFYIDDIFDVDSKPITINVSESIPFMISPLVIRDSMMLKRPMKDDPNTLRASFLRSCD